MSSSSAWQCWLNRHGLVLAACSALVFATSAGHSTGINIYVDVLMKDLGLSRTMFSGIWSLALTVSSALTPLAGCALDRWGARTFAAVAAVTQSLGLIALAGATSRVQLALLFCIIRFAGPECLCICASTTVNRWFVRHRGKASAIKAVMDNSAMVFPAYANLMIAAMGWRASLRIVGILFALVCVASVAVIRDTPEMAGLKPDGGGVGGGRSINDDLQLCGRGDDDEKGAQHKAEAVFIGLPMLGASGNGQGEPGGGAGDDGTGVISTDLDDLDWDFGDVMRTGVFWALTLTDSLYSLFWAGLNMHAVDFFTARGVSEARTGVASLSVPFALFLAVMAFCTGNVIDRCPNKLQVFGRINIVLACCMVLACRVRTYNGMAVFYTLYGAANGAKFSVESILLADMFGRACLGRVNSIYIAFHTLSSGLGPLAFGWRKEATGDYVGITMTLAAVNAAGGLLMATYLNLPKKRVRSN